MYLHLADTAVCPDVNPQDGGSLGSGLPRRRRVRGADLISTSGPCRLGDARWSEDRWKGGTGCRPWRVGLTGLGLASRFKPCRCGGNLGLRRGRGGDRLSRNGSCRHLRLRRIGRWSEALGCGRLRWRCVGWPRLGAGRRRRRIVAPAGLARRSH